MNLGLRYPRRVLDSNSDKLILSLDLPSSCNCNRFQIFLECYLHRLRSLIICILSLCLTCGLVQE